MNTFRIKLQWLPSLIIAFLGFLLPGYVVAQMGNHVFSGIEVANYGTIDLTLGSTWSTDRVAAPGYFSAIGTATYTNASDAKNVNGYVKHQADAANQAFSFPVGTGTDYRNLSISGTRSASSIIATAWIVGDPSSITDPTAPNAGMHTTTAMGAGITAVSPAGQWDWQDLSNNATGVTVTVSLPDVSSLGAATDLRLVGWDGTQWVNLSGVTGASGNTENSTLSGTMISGITALAVGQAGALAAGAIDCSKTQIFTAPVAGTASQNTLVVTVNVTAIGDFDLIVSGSGMSLANGMMKVTATATGIQTFHIPLKYDGTALGTLNFTVGVAGSCTANLTSNNKKVITDVWTLDNCTTVGPDLK